MFIPLKRLNRRRRLLVSVRLSTPLPRAIARGRLGLLGVPLLLFALRDAIGSVEHEVVELPRRDRIEHETCGKTATVTAGIVMVAEADFVVSACDVAVTVTIRGGESLIPFWEVQPQLVRRRPKRIDELVLIVTQGPVMLVTA
jgi:hypothetical protein